MCREGYHTRRSHCDALQLQQYEFFSDALFELQYELVTLQYQHGNYDHFYVTDPKQRFISKANVRDRIVHEVVYSSLTEIFDPKFTFYSLSSRIGKGTHFGVRHLRRMIRKVSANGQQPCYALKMDIKRFFDTVDQKVLKKLIRKTVKDEKVLSLIDKIIDSFEVESERGIPLGNVTSQLFANIYLHELDDYIKQSLNEKYYLRYCDDFIILSTNRSHLNSLIDPIKEFLNQNLHLELHPRKVIIRKLSQGIDFVGYVLFEKYFLIRTTTKRRMKKRVKRAHCEFLKGKIETSNLDQKIQSYLGILSHANQHTLSEAIKNAYWVR